MMKFGVGQSVTRKEDARLITGRGRFTDDIAIAGQAYGHVLRSPHAHARIERIDVAPAKKHPGVLAVLTGADVAAAKLNSPPAFGPDKNRDGSP
ncbi:MAG: xanthine dehydrogenase family protein molybdopterin-binding subunit, partial [Alphaproteobacteria bacterium]|nr:xanthine dehydrogenase family protein molybdopterin-binding subunit [Alphaproteobacteria bacterium]